ncbi:major capsid protein [Apis mellifera associated microvirus 18]|nr:major capsid protein [Apis mellifera associated microvirus 18]
MVARDGDPSLREDLLTMFDKPFANPRLQTSNHSFARVPQADIPRSTFNRSHGYKTTFDAGYLVPIFVDEALPGDTFSLHMTTFARLATPIAPLMDNLYCDVFFFAVPIRLVWDNWEKFNGAQDNPDDSTDFLTPKLTTPVGGWATESLSDYFGLPIGVQHANVHAFAHRAYNLIWNEWFRDQNLQDSLTVPKTDGPDSATLYSLKRRGKRHDYFTSALPWPQKGPAVNLPLGTEAPITSNFNGAIIGLGEASGQLARFRPTASTATPAIGAATTSGNPMTASEILEWPPSDVQYYNYADLSEATAATINQLREAFQMQKLFERDARGGTRYTEIIRSHFGVTSPDARLQRPEYLGGGSAPINVAPIPQTSSTDATTPQGNLAAMGTFSHSGIGFTKSFTEHCIVIGLISARADLNYQQGINRMWSRNTRYDFYWPALSHIGEQAVLNQEIYAQGTGDDDDVFGYQERYAEYRYKPSLVTGKFRSDASGSLDVWHLAQDFTGLPVLGDTFIQEDPPVDRVIAVPSEPHFLLDSAINLKCARPMPVYSVPGLIDHF